MNDHPEIVLDVDAGGMAVVTVGGETVTEIADLVKRAPQLAEPAHAIDFATAANHLARGFQYAVILDPRGFSERYLAERVAEEQNEPAEPGRIRLSNYEIPDLDAIDVPRMDAGKVIFFAEQHYLRIPYMVEITHSGSATYNPM